MERLVRRIKENDAGIETEDEEEEAEGGDGLRVNTGATEEEVAQIENTEMRMEVEGEVERKGTLMTPEDIWFLTQEAEPISSTLVGARNGFNDLRHLEILWTVQHLWPAGQC